MLPTNLNTNEVKNSAGTEVEFNRLSSSERSVTFAKVNESPAYQNRISVSHEETGEGINRVRNSVVRVDLSVQGQVDTTKVVKIPVYMVARIPVGNLTSLAEPTNAVAQLVSLVASRGVDSTIKFDGTGCGAEALINGSL